MDSSQKDNQSNLFEIKATLSLLLVRHETNSVYYQTRAKTAPAMAMEASKLIFKQKQKKTLILKFFERYLPYGLQQNMQLTTHKKNIFSLVSIAQNIFEHVARKKVSWLILVICKLVSFI